MICPKCGHKNAESATNCANCRVNLQWALEHAEEFVTEAEEKTQLEQLQIEREQHRANLIVTTTYSVEGRSVVQYLDVVTAEVVLGTGLLSELGAGIADLLGSRASGFQEKLKKAQQVALDELKDEAVRIGAHAIVGVGLNYMALASNMLMVTASGTAVKLAVTE